MEPRVINKHSSFAGCVLFFWARTAALTSILCGYAKINRGELQEEHGNIKVNLPDGAYGNMLQGTTIEDVAGSISAGLKKNAIAGKIDGKTVDVYTPLESDARLEIVTLDSADGLEVYRHSTAHLMAQAIKRIYGETERKARHRTCH